VCSLRTCPSEGTFSHSVKYRLFVTLQRAAIHRGRACFRASSGRLSTACIFRNDKRLAIYRDVYLAGSILAWSFVWVTLSFEWSYLCVVLCCTRSSFGQRRVFEASVLVSSIGCFFPMKELSEQYLLTTRQCLPQKNVPMKSIFTITIFWNKSNI